MAPSTEDKAIFAVTSLMDVVAKAITFMNLTIPKDNAVDFTLESLLLAMALIVPKDIAGDFTLETLLLGEDEVKVALLLPMIDCSASDNNWPRNVWKIYLPRNV